MFVYIVLEKFAFVRFEDFHTFLLLVSFKFKFGRMLTEHLSEQSTEKFWKAGR
jgi:hypothetical protein